MMCHKVFVNVRPGSDLVSSAALVRRGKTMNEFMLATAKYLLIPACVGEDVEDGGGGEQKH